MHKNSIHVSPETQMENGFVHFDATPHHNNFWKVWTAAWLFVMH